MGFEDNHTLFGTAEEGNRRNSHNTERTWMPVITMTDTTASSIQTTATKELILTETTLFIEYILD